MPNIQWTKREVPGAAEKLALRSLRLKNKVNCCKMLKIVDNKTTYVASNKGSEQISNHQPQTKGKTPISTTDSNETFTTM